MWKRGTGIAIFVMCMANISQCNDMGKTQSMLLRKIFRNYNNVVRPMCVKDKPIETMVGIAIRQIIEIDEPTQVLTFNAWIKLKWDDCRLKWNSSENNLTRITVPAYQIWKPDITLADFADHENDRMPGFETFLATIYSNGNVRYSFQTVIKVFCKMEITYFPFDQQICPLHLSSWAYDGHQVYVVNETKGGDISRFQTSVEWDLVGVPVKYINITHECCKTDSCEPYYAHCPYTEVEFDLILKRKPNFYVTGLMFPCGLITSVCLFGFLLPAETSEKVSLEVTVLLSLAVFLFVVSEQLPPSSEHTPLIKVFFGASMVIVALATLATVIILNIHHKGEQRKKVPKWLYWLSFHYIGPCMLVDSSWLMNDVPIVKVGLDTNTNGTNSSMPARNEEARNSRRVTRVFSSDDSAHRFSVKFEEARQIIPPERKLMEDQLEVMESQLEILEIVAEKEKRRYQRVHLCNEWKQISIIFDRLFFLVFTLVVVVTLSTITYMMVYHDAEIDQHGYHFPDV